MFPKFRLTATADQLANWAAVPLSGIPQLALVQTEAFPTVYPVLRLSPTTGKRVLSPLRLGLIPSYAHDDHEADHFMEAHAEAMTCCNNFRSAFNRRRCLIPATSFHEFTKVARPGATPSSFSLKNEAIFAIAGVWESWLDDSGKTVETFALIDAHPVAALHSHFDRIPVVIADVDQERWLNPQARPLDLLKPLSPAEQIGWKMMPYLALPSLEARLPGQEMSMSAHVVGEQTYSGL